MVLEEANEPWADGFVWRIAISGRELARIDRKDLPVLMGATAPLGDKIRQLANVADVLEALDAAEAGVRLSPP